MGWDLFWVQLSLVELVNPAFSVILQPLGPLPGIPGILSPIS